MQSNLFRYTKTLFSKITQPFILALFVFISVVTIGSITHAQTTIDLQNKYAPYLNLFPQNTPVFSIPSNGGLIKDVTNNNVTGLKLDIKFAFTPSTTTSNEASWKLIQNDGAFTNASAEETFIVRICNTVNSSQCFLQQVPYDDNADDSGTIYAHISRKDLAGNFAPGNAINDFSILGNKGPTPFLDGVRHIYNRTTTDGKNEGTLRAYDGKLKLNSSILEATLWYCAANNGTNTGETAYQDIGHGLNDSIATFGTLCGGKSYFRIGAPLQITIPSAGDTAAVAAGTNTQTASSSTQSGSETNLPTCGIVPLQSGTIVGCLAQLVYYGVYWPIAWLAGLFGTLFDFFIGYSVSDESYRYGFAVTGWKLVRDIANIFFIIIMVYTGFAAVFSFGGAGGASMKRIIPFLIINALIINFSLFATRTVIDISNITARVFYSRMIVCDGPCGPNVPGTNIPENVKRSPLGGYWPLSEKIVSSFDPQRMFGPSVLNPKETVTGAGNPGDPFVSNSASAARIAEQQKGFGQDTAEYAGYYAIVSLIAAIIMAFIAVMFFKVMFMFVGRVMGLYLAMIFSPFAFLTLNGAGGKIISDKLELFEWSTWSRDLFNYAALAPVFIFFLYIVYSFLSTDLVTQIGLKDETGGFFGTVLMIAIPMIIIYFLIDHGAKLASKYAGSIGNFVQNKLSSAVGGIGGIVGGGIGIAAGAGAFLGRNVAARGIGAMANAKRADGTSMATRLAAAAPNNRWARGLSNTLAKTQSGTWDMRNTKLNSAVNTGMEKLSFGQIKLNDKFSSALGIGKDAGKGGVVAIDKKRTEDRKKELDGRINFDHLSDDDVKIAWESYKKKKLASAGEANWKNSIENDTTIKSLADQVKRNQQHEEDLVKAIEKLKTDAEQARSANRAADATALTNELSAKTIELDRIKTYNATVADNLEKKKKEKIDELSKDGKFKESTAYTASQEEEKKRLEEYGTIKKGKQLSSAMRSEYGKELNKSSLWLEDGKATNFKAVAGVAAASALAVALPGIGTVVGALIIKELTKGMVNNSFGDINAKATEDMIKNFKKTQGIGSKEGKLTKNLEDINGLIEEAVKDHFKGENGKIDDWDKDKTKIEEGIAGKISILEDKMSTLNADISRESDPTKKRLLIVKKKVIQKQISKLDGAIEAREKAQEELDKHKDKEEAKKKSDEGKDSTKK